MRAVTWVLCGLPFFRTGRTAQSWRVRKEAAMRRTLFWLGMIVLIALPVVYAVQIVVTQDLPRVEVWKWAVLFAAVILVYFARNHDEVLRHRLV